ncbi:unnamed protein product [Ectocarpus sp. 12 AP-2014]
MSIRDALTSNYDKINIAGGVPLSSCRCAKKITASNFASILDLNVQTYAPLRLNTIDTRLGAPHQQHDTNISPNTQNTTTTIRRGKKKINTNDQNKNKVIRLYIAEHGDN